MRRFAWASLAALSLGACLYTVADVESGAGATGGEGGGEAGGDVVDEDWLGGSGGADAAAEGGDAGADAADAGPDVEDAAVDVPDAGQDAPSVAWSSCKSLGYAGKCFGGTSLLFFDKSPCGQKTDKCWLNDCSLAGGKCVAGASGSCGGSECTIGLTGQEESCTGWDAGQCHNGAAIKPDPALSTNCLYKDCAALGKTCATKGGVLDCY